jgi:hypothetical protein
VTQPFNLDAVVSETGSEPFDFTFGGEGYTLPAQVDLLAAASLEGGKLYEGLHRLMGDDQWDRLLASKAVMDNDKLKALMEAYAAHVGLSLGESGASTGSSVSTEGPSKRISNGSTGSPSQTLSKVV